MNVSYFPDRTDNYPVLPTLVIVVPSNYSTQYFSAFTIFVTTFVSSSVVVFQIALWFLQVSAMTSQCKALFGGQYVVRVRNQQIEVWFVWVLFLHIDTYSWFFQTSVVPWFFKKSSRISLQIHFLSVFFPKSFPSLQLPFLPLKMVAWKMNLLLGPPPAYFQARFG